mgnify:CR=1 FL=1
MKLVEGKEQYKDCRICVNVIKDKQQNVIGCQSKDNCVFEERK